MFNDPVVAQAIRSVRERYASDAWVALKPGEITAEIYREIRRLDLLRVQQRAVRREREEAAA